MLTHLRHRVVMLLVAVAAVIAATVSHTGTTVADQYCPAGTNWDSVTQTCR